MEQWELRKRLDDLVDVLKENESFLEGASEEEAGCLDDNRRDLILTLHEYKKLIEKN